MGNPEKGVFCKGFSVYTTVFSCTSNVPTEYILCTTITIPIKYFFLNHTTVRNLRVSMHDSDA